MQRKGTIKTEEDRKKTQFSSEFWKAMSSVQIPDEESTLKTMLSMCSAQKKFIPEAVPEITKPENMLLFIRQLPLQHKMKFAEFYLTTDAFKQLSNKYNEDAAFSDEEQECYSFGRTTEDKLQSADEELTKSETIEDDEAGHEKESATSLDDTAGHKKKSPASWKKSAPSSEARSSKKVSKDRKESLPSQFFTPGNASKLGKIVTLDSMMQQSLFEVENVYTRKKAEDKNLLAKLQRDRELIQLRGDIAKLRKDIIQPASHVQPAIKNIEGIKVLCEIAKIYDDLARNKFNKESYYDYPVKYGQLLNDNPHGEHYGRILAAMFKAYYPLIQGQLDSLPREMKGILERMNSAMVDVKINLQDYSDLNLPQSSNQPSVTKSF